MRLFLLLLLSFLIVSCAISSNTKDENPADATQQEIVVNANPEDTEQVASNNKQTNDESLKAGEATDDGNSTEEDSVAKENGSFWWNPLSWFQSKPKEGETADNKTVSVEEFEELKNLMEPKVLTKEEEERLRVEDIDKNFYFKSNIVMDYYGLPVTIIRMPADWSKAVKNNTIFVSNSTHEHYLQGLPSADNDNNLMNESLLHTLSSNDEKSVGEMRDSDNVVLSDQEKKNIEVLKKQKEVDNLLNNKKGDSANKIIDISLTKQHEGLLINLVSKVTNADEILVLMFVRGSKMSEWDNSTEHIYRNIYIQNIISFLYNNFKNIKIEKRYINNMPKDEVFLVALNYVGALDFNVYNAKPESISQWLIRYRDVELARIKKDAEEKKQLEELISGTASED